MLAGAALGLLVCPAAWADVLPARRGAKSGDPGRVAERLAQVGVPKAEAAAQAGSMTPGDLEYFSRGESRVQVVAGLWLEEAIGAAAVFLVIGGIYAIIQSDINDRD